jgi:hypothetical protein
MATYNDDTQQRKAREFWEQAKNHLIQQLQPWEARGRHNPLNIGRARMGPNGMTSAPTQGTEFRAHAMPSDHDVERFIKSLGGNPYAQVATGANAERATVAHSDASGPPSMDVGGMFSKMLAANQAKVDEANAANLARYDEGHGEYSALRDRNQERAKNWGVAASRDIDQRMQDALLKSEASLASRGLAGSTIADSFRLQTAKDTALEQQRVSEMRDSRASEYDTRDTGNLVGFVERREDTAPDSNQMMQLAMQYGLAQQQLANQKANNDAMNAALANSGKGGRGDLGIPGPRGGAMPMFMNGSPVQLAAMMGMMRNPLAGPQSLQVLASKRGRKEQPVSTDNPGAITSEKQGKKWMRKLTPSQRANAVKMSKNAPVALGVPAPATPGNLESMYRWMSPTPAPTQVAMPSLPVPTTSRYW